MEAARETLSSEIFAALSRRASASARCAVWASAQMALNFQHSTPWLRSSRVTFAVVAVVAGFDEVAGAAALEGAANASHMFIACRVRRHGPLSQFAGP